MSELDRLARNTQRSRSAVMRMIIEKTLLNKGWSTSELLDSSRVETDKTYDASHTDRMLDTLNNLSDFPDHIGTQEMSSEKGAT
ncbi:MAG: hypothetical protein GYB50_09205 [Rhodobacteraceae bacterium]|nr:hypothetical protein [Salipiger thiooxidans]MBR9838048.1 hypothetical protein [Paracoccaceae bacterium]